MRVLGIVVALALASGSAYAEKVKANQETRVLNHPGEQGKLVVKVKEGQSMTLLSSEGRWLKVRVQGRTGWVPRSKVEMADPDEIARNTRRRPFVDGRSTHRGFGSQEAPDDRIGADAVGGGGNDDDAKSDDKPATKKPAKGDDADDDDKPAAKKPAAKKPAAKGDDDDDDDKPAAKKPTGKTPPAAAKKPAKGDDDDDDDAKPAAKKPAPAAAKKPAAKGDDDDDDENPIKGAAAKKPAAKPAPAAKKGDDDGDDDDDKKPVAKKGDAKGDKDDDGDDAEPAAAPKRAKAHVSGKEKVFGERDPSSDVEFTAKASDVLYPGETKGDWTKVESDDGDEGWILTDKLEVEGGGGGGHKRAINIGVGLGVGYLSQSMNTVGTTKTTGDRVPDVYDIGTSTGSLSLGGSFFTGLGAKYLVGVDAGYSYSKTVGGGVTYMKTVTGLSISDLTLRGAIGYPTSRPSGLTLIARLGIRYRGYLVDNYKTEAAKIPQETLFAPTIGFGVALPKLTDKLGLQIGLDAILFGASISQTAGLEDGATPGMTNVNFNAALIYAMSSVNLIFAYDLDHGSYDFGAPNTGAAAMSTRGHTGTDVTRSDTMHSLLVSVAKGF